MRIRAGAILGIAALLAGTITRPASAQEATTPNIEARVTVRYDGTAPFAGDPATGGAHTPGRDANGTNNVVRTFDTIGYSIDWNVNEVATTNVVLTATLPQGTQWLPDPNNAPFRGCLSTGTPASSISADGRTLTCNVGDHTQGEHGQVRPVATVTPTEGVDQLLDGATVPMQVSFASDANPQALANLVTTTVSATTSWNWVKGAPQVYNDVMSGGVPGKVLVYPIAFRPDSMSLVGSEPVDDSKPIVFWDHAVDLVPSARLADASFSAVRNVCGGYDGSGSYPYGESGIGSAVNTTAGAMNASEAITCTDVTASAANGYPTIKIEISGHNTATRPAKTAAGDANTYGIATQIAFWMPNSELFEKGEPSDEIPDNGVGTAPLLNVISGASTAVPKPSYGTPATVPPILVASAGGDLDESETKKNSAWSGISFGDGAGSAGGTVAGSSEYAHRARIVQPMQQATVPISSPVMGTVPAGLDTRIASLGGIGWSGFSASDPFSQNGTVPRAQEVTLSYELTTWSQTGLSRPVHGCMSFDNAHMSVKAHSGTMLSSAISAPALNATTVSQTTQALSDGPFAQVWAGQGIYRFDDVYNTRRVMAASPYSGVPEKVDYVVEFAASATGFAPSTSTNGTTCNNSDADTRGWVAADQAAAVFDSDGDGVAADINLVRIRTLNNTPWYNVDDAKNDFGAVKPGVQLLVAIPAQLSSSRDINSDGTKIRLHSSRASGAWDPAVADAPPSILCAGVNAPTRDQALGTPAEGWCNRPSDEAGEGSSPSTSVDPNAFTVLSPIYQRDVDTDLVTVVAAVPAITKVDVAGLNHVVDNGDQVTYELRPSIVGSPQETLTNVRVTEFPPSELSFVSSTPAPSGLDGDGHPYWDFGSQVGGWAGPTINAVFRVTGAVGDSRLSNRADITADDSPTATATAYEFTPPSVADAAVVKAVDTLNGPCVTHPTEEPAPVGWGERCSLIDLNGNMSFQLTAANNGNTRLNNYRIIDVFPHNGDGSETASGTGVVGDGRTPGSMFDGTLSFVSATSNNAGVRFLYTADAPADINRDPAVSETTNTWCDAPFGGTVVFGDQADCPAAAGDVTALYAADSALMPEEILDVQLTLDSNAAQCDNVWTNTFGGRTDGLTLPIRSNDVSIMTDCTYDLALRKTVSRNWSPGAGWMTPGTSTVDFAIEVINQGDTVEDFDVTDYVDPAKWEGFDPALNAPGVTTGDAELGYSWDPSDPNAPVAKVKGVLAEGQRVTIPIRLKVASGWTGTELRNVAEISRFDNNGDASDGDSSPSNPDNPASGALTDVDSTPDGTNTDPLVDDVIDNGGGDEDDHDIAVVPYLDLALRKRLDYAALKAQNPLGAGKTVRFNIEVFNQGTVAANAISLMDYVDQTMWEPFDAALNPAGTSTGAATLPYTWAADGTNGAVSLTGPIQPGQSAILPVTLTIKAGADVKKLVNKAEITSETAVDSEGSEIKYPNESPLTDIDSTPDSDDGDPLTDDVIDNADGDQDDHDVAHVQYLDASLRKTVNRAAKTTQLPPKPGGTITFNIEIFNQGTTWIDDLELVDYVNLSSFDAFDLRVNPSGSTTGDGEFPYVWSAAGSNGAVAIDGRLAPGKSIIVPVTLRIAADADVDKMVNTAEITKETGVDETGTPIVDPDGKPIPDIDSIPDPDTGDPEVDDEIDNGGGDEDDSDSADVAYLDLALRKTVSLNAPTTQLPVRDGRTVTFDIEVINQGNTNAAAISLVDYVDQEMWERFDVADNPAGTTSGALALPYAWEGSGTDGRVTITGTLKPKQSVVVPVTLTVRSGADLDTLSNLAEITGATAVDENGDTLTDPDGSPLIDVDSTPDDANTDPLTDDVIDGSDGDEDDHDVASVPKSQTFDLALRKTIDPKKNSKPLLPGGPVIFSIEVFNQGTTHAKGVTVTDYLPKGLVLADEDWTDNGDGTAKINLDGTLAPGESVVVDITFNIPDTATGKFVNLAEVSKATPVDPDGKTIIDTTTGEPILDVDSLPDGSDSDDLVNDEIFNSGGDEDDHDIADLVVDFYDLSLVKALAVGQKTLVAKGDDVTFDISVTNEGTLPIKNFSVVDRLPAGMAYSENNTFEWKPKGDNSYVVTVDKALKPGETATVTMVATITVDKDGAEDAIDDADAADGLTVLVNVAEISEVIDPAGKAVVDIDSIVDNRKDDEDDIAPAPVALSFATPVPVPAPTPAPTPAPPASSPPVSLALTGGSISWLLLLAAWMVLSGIAVANRRRV